MLIVANSSSTRRPLIPPGLGCGCKKSHGLGALTTAQWNALNASPILSPPSAAGANACTDPSNVSPACVAYLKSVAVSNGVDPSYIDQGVAAGMDSIQLFFVANKTSGPEQALAAAQTVSQDVGSSNYPASGGGTPTTNPPTSWWSEDSLGLGLSNGTYLLIAGGAVAGIAVLGKFL